MHINNDFIIDREVEYLGEINIYKKIKKLAIKHEDEVVKIRRDIHMHPELGFQEERTARIVESKLNELGIEVQTGVGKTGVVGILNGKKEGKIVALRADMDALPIQEETDLSFKSINDGVMHACGHDSHTANLLGVAMILSELRDEINGQVKFIFQPSEEVNAGAREMLKSGRLDEDKIDAIFGLHVVPLPVGHITYGYGEQTAYTDFFKFKINGKQSHTAKPHEGIDAILIAGHIITAVQSILSRSINPFEVATFSLGKINGGTAVNIVPDYVEIEGMIRVISKDTRDIILDRIANVSKSVAQAMGGNCDLILSEGYPAVINEKGATDFFKSIAQNSFNILREDLGIDNSKDINEFVYCVDKPILAAEDFGFFSQKIPACYFSVGAGNLAPQHNPKFMIDERVFKITLNLMSAVAIEFLK